jgi:hypothetical protein
MTRILSRQTLRTRIAFAFWGVNILGLVALAAFALRGLI